MLKDAKDWGERVLWDSGGYLLGARVEIEENIRWENSQTRVTPGRPINVERNWGQGIFKCSTTEVRESLRPVYLSVRKRKGGKKEKKGKDRMTHRRIVEGRGGKRKAPA